ncbi:MAG: hypothetical protein ACLR43_13065 [Faecalibacillus faecis]
MGLSIVESIYGQTGLLYASIALIPQRIFSGVRVYHYLHKQILKNTYQKVVFHPCIIAVYIGLPI